MDDRTLIILLLGLLAAIGGSVYRRLRAKSLLRVSDEEFISVFLARQEVSASREAILEGRRYIARVLGIPIAKLSPEHTVEFLSARFSYLAEFSVAWNDLHDEAEEARDAAGLDRREVCPTTIGELLEDILLARKNRSGRSEASNDLQ
jgi:hypothetical protein